MNLLCHEKGATHNAFGIILSTKPTMWSFPYHPFLPHSISLRYKQHMVLLEPN